MSENEGAASPWSREAAVGSPGTDPAPAAATVQAGAATPAAGWYPDPADAVRQRYWDGTHWTVETRTGSPTPLGPRPTPGFGAAPAGADPYAGAVAATPAPAVTPVPPPPLAPAAPVAPAWGATPGLPPAPPVAASPAPMPVYPANPAYPGVPNPYFGNAAPLAYAPPRFVGPQTADGVPLSGWWWRVLAMFLDSIFVGLVAGSVLVMTVFSDLSALAGPALRAMLADPSGYATSPGYLAFEPRMMQYSLALSAAQAVYAIVLLAWRGATFGQTICQIRVVPVDQGRHGGGLPIGQVLIRGVAFMLLYDLNTIVSVIAPDAATSFGWLLTLAGLLCVLWALWSPKKQCWHDMIARTQVVRPAG